MQINTLQDAVTRLAHSIQSYQGAVQLLTTQTGPVPLTQWSGLTRLATQCQYATAVVLSQLERTEDTFADAVLSQTAGLTKSGFLAQAGTLDTAARAFHVAWETQMASTPGAYRVGITRDPSTNSAVFGLSALEGTDAVNLRTMPELLALNTVLNGQD
jgi:hypothetical protein